MDSGRQQKCHSPKGKDEGGKGGDQKSNNKLTERLAALKKDQKSSSP